AVRRPPACTLFPYTTLFRSVYALGPSRLGITAGDLLFVSSNAWHVAGAKAFGYRVAWCNRGNAPEEELGLRADCVVRTLDELPRSKSTRLNSSHDQISYAVF